MRGFDAGLCGTARTSSDGGAKCDDVDATGLMNPPADRDGVELGLEDQALTGAPPAPTWVGNTSSRAISPVPGAGPKLQPPDRHRSDAELSSYLTASPHASRTMKPPAKCVRGRISPPRFGKLARLASVSFFDVTLTVNHTMLTINCYFCYFESVSFQFDFRTRRSSSKRGSHLSKP